MKLKHPKNLSFILVGASLFLGVAPASAGSDAQVLRKARKQIQALQVLDRRFRHRGSKISVAPTNGT
jgi:hypothetical protein